MYRAWKVGQNRLSDSEGAGLLDLTVRFSEFSQLSNSCSGRLLRESPNFKEYN
jgi:hypothetical protein